MEQQSVVQWLQDIYNNCNEYEKFISKSDWKEAEHIEKFIIEKAIDEALNAYGIIKKQITMAQTLEEIKQIAESMWEGCHGCDETDKQMWINGFVTGYLTSKSE